MPSYTTHSPCHQLATLDDYLFYCVNVQPSWGSHITQQLGLKISQHTYNKEQAKYLYLAKEINKEWAGDCGILYVKEVIDIYFKQLVSEGKLILFTNSSNDLFLWWHTKYKKWHKYYRRPIKHTYSPKEALELLRPSIPNTVQEFLHFYERSE